MIWLFIILLVLIVLTGCVMYIGIGKDSGKGSDIVDNMSDDSYDITRKKAKYRVVFSPESQKRFIDNKGNVRDTVIPTY